MALVQKEVTNISRKIGTNDKQNEAIVKELVEETIKHLSSTINCNTATSNDFKQQLKSHFDEALKQFFDYRDSLTSGHWEKSKLLLIVELKAAFSTFCFDFTNKLSTYLSEAGLSFRTQADVIVNSKCLPIENLNNILSDVKAKVMHQYEGSTVPDAGQLNKRLDEESQFYISENNRRLGEIYLKYNSILGDLLAKYELLVEMRLPDEQLETASEQKLESTFKVCKMDVLFDLNEKMQFKVAEIKSMFENRIEAVIGERFSEKITASKLRKQRKIAEAVDVISNAVDSFAESMSEVFGAMSNPSDVNSIRNTKMNESMMSITESIYYILPDREDAKQMIELAKQKFDNVFQDLQSQRDVQTQKFQKQWETELISICDTFNQRFYKICQSEILPEQDDLRAKRDIIIGDLINEIIWLNADNKTDLIEEFKFATKQQMETLSLPILEKHSKILTSNFEQQKLVMNGCLEAYQMKMKELLKDELNGEVYVKAQTIGEAAIEQFEIQVKNIVPISPAATIRLRNDLRPAISRIQSQFEKEVKDRNLIVSAQVSQLVTDVLDDYKQLINAFSIAANFSKAKIGQIHYNLKTRSQASLQKNLRLAKYSGDFAEQQRKLETMIDRTYNDNIVAIDNQRVEWDQKLVSCGQKANIHYKQLFNSNLGSAVNEKDLERLHKDFKDQAITLWEESFPIQYFGDKLLPEQRKFAKQLDFEFKESFFQMWQQTNLAIDRNTRDAVEKFVKQYEEKMNFALVLLEYTSDEVILTKHEQFSKAAKKDLNNVDKPKTISKKVYDDLLSTRLDCAFNCIQVQNTQKKEAIQSDLSNEIVQLKETLKRELFNLKVLPEASQLFNDNRFQAERLANKYKIENSFKQELVTFTKEKLLDSLNDIKSEWDSIQPDPNQLQLAINGAVNEYDKEMENRTSKTGQIFMSKAMKIHHGHSLQVVQKKFQEAIKQTSATQEQFNKAIEEVLKKFEDHNDLRAAEYSEAAIGIDLGTTFSCVAIYKGNKIEMIPDREHHSNTVPSYVYYESSTKTVVGHSAKDQSVIHPQTTIFDSKRLIGRKFNDPKTQKDITQWPFKVIRDPDLNRKEPKIEVHGTTFHPEEVSGEILKHLKKNAELYLGREVKDVVITVPAYFNDAQKRATKNAAAFANINVLEIINEPTAAAIAYSLNYTTNKNILVFDLGGGTFDVSVISTEKSNIKVKAVGGDDHLGGEDFDSNMVDFCVKKFQQETGLTIRKNVSSSEDVAVDGDEEKRKVLETLRRLRQKCEQAKINLSKTDKVRVVVDYIYNQKNLDVEITVKDFNEMNKELFKKCIKVVEKTVNDSKLSKVEIDDVVLVGGSSRIPEVQRLLSEFFDGKSLIMTINPDEVVAQGAAYRAAMISGSKSRELADIKFQDVNPLSLGIEVLGKLFATILPRNTPLPAKRTESFVTTRDYQTEINVAIYEGEDDNVANNNLLGEFTLLNIPSKRRGEEPVDVSIECDEEGLIHVTAKVESNSSTSDIKIQSNRGGLTEDDIKSAMSRNMASEIAITPSNEFFIA